MPLIEREVLQNIARSARDSRRGSTRNSPIHRWYLHNMSYSDRLVGSILSKAWNDGPAHVLDPFSGSGTTLVEAMLRGHHAVGIDVNPACVFLAKVKTDWGWEPDELGPLALEAIEALGERWRAGNYVNDRRFSYTVESGLVDRGWLSRYKLGRIVSLLQAIETIACPGRYRRIMRAAVAAAVRETLADVRFGPEVYCLSKRRRTRVETAFLAKIGQFLTDREALDGSSEIGSARVVEGDARRCGAIVERIFPDGVDLVITSPPYPNEHDYTRNTRLELIMLGFVQDVHDLRRIKKRMIRSTTKGIYVGDDEGDLVEDCPEVARIAKALRRKSEGAKDGFSRLYGTVVMEYFGGMARHLQSVRECLRSKGLAFYVVSDQSCFLGVHVNTPRIVERLAIEGGGLQSLGRFTIATRRGTTGTRMLREQVIVLRR